MRWAVVVGALLVAAPVHAEPAVDPWYAAHAFIGGNGSLGLQADSALRVGDRLLVFEGGQAARRRSVLSVVSAESANGGGLGLASRVIPAAKAIAQFERPGRADVDERGRSLVYALAGTPTTTIAIGANAHAMDARALQASLEQLRGAVPAEFLRSSALRRGRVFHSREGGEIVELCLGVPVRQAPRHGATLRSVRILRAYVRNGHLLGSERIARRTGKEEHVDLEPPRLTERNWCDVFEQPIGFVSRDAGATWARVSLDVGFEGITWRVSRLAPGLPELWSTYLYTQH